MTPDVATPLSLQCVCDARRQVVKALRKGETGVCIIAGNISPIDVISHIPVRLPPSFVLARAALCDWWQVLCEESSVPYVYTRSKVMRDMCCHVLLQHMVSLKSCAGGTGRRGSDQTPHQVMGLSAAC